MKIYKISIKTLLQDGFVELYPDESKKYSSYIGAVIYDLVLANKVRGYKPDYIEDEDIFLHDYFENPLEPNETEMSLFRLAFGFSLEFVAGP